MLCRSRRGGRRMKTLVMMRTRGLIQPMVKKGNKAATTTNKSGATSAGPYIIYKQNNP